MTSSAFQYQSLTSSSSFRIFRLLAPALDDPEAIAIELCEADLGSNPAFEAISYAWGREEANVTISCNGSPFRITPNVASVLRALQRRADCQQVLWVDSICINQDSVEERNIQVPKMRSIYGQAAKVWVWLGDESFEIQATFDYLLAVSDLMNGQFGFHNIVSKASGLRADFEAKVRASRGFYDSVDTNFITDLINLPWFRRTWTVQELVLANEAILLSGKNCITWISFTEVLFILQQAWYVDLQTWFSNPATFYNDLSCYHRIHKIVTYETIRNPVSTALTSVRTKHSSDPKDKVYGLYGIFDRIHVSNLPRVNYSESVEAIYTEMTRTAIEFDRSLDILDELCLPSRLPELPSWVPDWSNTAYIFPLQGTPLASGASKVAWNFNGWELTVEGMLIDDVVDTAHSSSVSTPDFRRGYAERRKDMGEDAKRRHDAVVELVRTMKAWVQFARLHQPGKGQTRVFDRIFFDLTPSGLGQVISERSHQEELIGILMSDEPGSVMSLTTVHESVRDTPQYTAIKEDYISVCQCSENVDEWCNEMKIRLFLRVRSPAVARLQHDLALNTYQRTLFTTRDGYIGVGPRWAQVGDQIALIAGYGRPFVVRREGSKYRFVGPAHINGIMFGERWDQTKLQKLTFV